MTEKIKSYRYGKLFLEEYSFKTSILATCSLIVTVAFAVMNGVSGVLYSSIWYGALAAYYLALIIFRTSVILVNLRCKKKYADTPQRYERATQRIHLASGALLIPLEIAMAVAVTQMVLSERPVKSGEIMAISTAAYTFYKMTVAIVNFVKARRHADPVSQALRNLNVVDACMSMASLTALLITTFDEEGGSADMFVTKACVGAAACLIGIALASYMIITASKKLKEETHAERREG